MGKTFGVAARCEAVGLVVVEMGGGEGSVQIGIAVRTEISWYRSH